MYGIAQLAGFSDLCVPIKHIMKKAPLLVLLVLATFQIAFSQTLAPAVIASTGGLASTANVNLSYTVGEMTMVKTFSSGNAVLTQGFQQPNANVTGLIELSRGEAGSFVLYPNPAVDNLWIGFEFPEAGSVSITLFNALGQKIKDVYHTNYENGKTVQALDVSLLASGMYYMSLTFTANRDGKKNTHTQKLNIIR
jgi:hypothetical protein